MISQDQHLPKYSHGRKPGCSGGGTTFRAWAPLASAVDINGTFGGAAMTGQTDNLLSPWDSNGYWTGFVRDRAGRRSLPVLGCRAGRERTEAESDSSKLPPASAFPNCNSLIRSSTAYPWHDSAFVTPDFSNMIIYQLHIGTYAPSAPGSSRPLFSM